MSDEIKLFFGIGILILVLVIAMNVGTYMGFSNEMYLIVIGSIISVFGLVAVASLL